MAKTDEARLARCLLNTAVVTGGAGTVSHSPLNTLQIRRSPLPSAATTKFPGRMLGWNALRFQTRIGWRLPERLLAAIANRHPNWRSKKFRGQRPLA